jgi:tetratricopeptide (TPR) repeat protein
VTRRLALLLILLAAVVPVSQGRVDAGLGAPSVEQEVLYLWTGGQVRRLFPGFEALAADLYWLRTVQYFGSQRRFAVEKRFDLLRPLIEITTDLDPRLEVAYRYGAIFLAEPAPEGAGRPREAVAVLEKGIRNNPRSWRLREELGFFHYLFLRQPERASEILLTAAELPGAPFWLRTLAADLLQKGGERQAARRMWQRMYEQSEEGALKENARFRLRMLDSADAADALTAAVAEFARRFGRRPSRLEELTAAGLWRGPLVDAAQVPFSYDGSSGRVGVSRSSPMWRPE